MEETVDGLGGGCVHGGNLHQSFHIRGLDLVQRFKVGQQGLAAGGTDAGNCLQL